MGDKWSQPDRLRDLLDPIGRKLGMEDAVDAGRLFARWSRIVGADVAAHVEPTSLRDGVLRVRVDSPAWGTEVGYLADEIAARVNSEMGRPVVSELRVSAGPRLETPAPAPSGGPASRASRTPSDEAPADPRVAFERAREAWARKNRKRGSDQDF